MAGTAHSTEINVETLHPKQMVPMTAAEFVSQIQQRDAPLGARLNYLT